MRSRTTLVATGVLVLVAIGASQAVQAAMQQQPTVQAPRFEVEVTWPKPLPNHWIIGSAVGVAVDSRDHVFIIHRGDSTLEQRTESGGAAKHRSASAAAPRRRCWSSTLRAIS